MRRDRPPITDVPRDEYVKRCKQQAIIYLREGDLVKAVASTMITMDARTDCKLPIHLVSLAYSLLLAKDALGLKVMIEELK